jgi:hypothetical protein
MSFAIMDALRTSVVSMPSKRLIVFWGTDEEADYQMPGEAR